jgi:hypothetical protein
MRNSFSRVTSKVAVAACLVAFCFAGCQSTGTSKLSKPDWFSWGKKKPSSTALGSTKSGTDYPAPPSNSATPNPVPSYAQSGAKSGYAGSPAGTAPGYTGVAASPASYGSTGPNADYYSKAPYGGGVTAGVAPQGTASTPYGRSYPTAGTSGYGAPGYGDSYTQPPAGAAYGGSVGTRPSASYAGAYPGSTSNPGNVNSTYGAASGQAAGAYTPNAATPAYDAGVRASGSRGYGQDANAAAPYATDPRSGATAPGTYGQTQPYYGGSNSGAYAPKGGSFGQDRREPAAGYAENSATRTDGTTATAGAGYRWPPGSTKRPTRFGDSQQLDVSGADNVQSTSFNSTNEAGSRTSVNDPVPSSSGENDSGASYPSTRTATGGGSAYPVPNTYTR